MKTSYKLLADFIGGVLDAHYEAEEGSEPEAVTEYRQPILTAFQKSVGVNHRDELRRAIDYALNHRELDLGSLPSSAQVPRDDDELRPMLEFARELLFGGEPVSPVDLELPEPYEPASYRIPRSVIPLHLERLARTKNDPAAIRSTLDRARYRRWFQQATEHLLAHPELDTSDLAPPDSQLDDRAVRSLLERVRSVAWPNTLIHGSNDVQLVADDTPLPQPWLPDPALETAKPPIGVVDIPVSTTRPSGTWRTILSTASGASDNAKPWLGPTTAILEAALAGKGAPSFAGAFDGYSSRFLDAIDQALRTRRDSLPGNVVAASRAVLRWLSKPLATLALLPHGGPAPRPDETVGDAVSKMERWVPPVRSNDEYRCPRCGSQAVQSRDEKVDGRYLTEAVCEACGEGGSWFEDDAPSLRWNVHP